MRNAVRETGFGFSIIIDVYIRSISEMTRYPCYVDVQINSFLVLPRLLVKYAIGNVVYGNCV